MAQPTNSFAKFNYSLRPSKQVERKILIELLSDIAGAGYRIRDYTYLGFGSVYYVDFVMFHKYLFIDSMVCVEWGDIPRRMRFNKPYRFIKLRMGAIGDLAPEVIGSRKKFLAWLGYDRQLDGEML